MTTNNSEEPINSSVINSYPLMSTYCRATAGICFRSQCKSPTCRITFPSATGAMQPSVLYQFLFYNITHFFTGLILSSNMLNQKAEVSSYSPKAANFKYFRVYQAKTWNHSMSPNDECTHFGKHCIHSESILKTVLKKKYYYYFIS